MEIIPAKIVSFSFLEAAVLVCFFPQVQPTGTLASFFFINSLINWTIFGIYHLIIYPFFLSPLRHLPQPRRGFIPIVGHGLSMFSQPPGNGHLKMMKNTAYDGIVYYRGLFHADRIIVASPAAIADILVHKSYDFQKPPLVISFLRQFLGDGLLMTEGEQHRHDRKHIMPAFHFRHIRELCPVFWAKSMELCKIVQADIAPKTDKVVEITHFSTQVTMDIIGLAGLGREIGSLRNSDDELIRIFEEVLEPSTEKGLYFAAHMLFPPWFIKALPWKLNQRVRSNMGELRRICRGFVVEKKARLKMGSEDSADILSIMIRSNNFSDDGLVDQLLTFLAAGHETTSSAFTWTTHLLATHPAIQSRLRREIHKAIPSPNALSDPSFDIAGLLEPLPYLNAVCNEVLRLYPTVPKTTRISTRDTTIDGHFVPKGTLSLIVPWATNRDPRWWGADAEKFMPKRWIDAETGRTTMDGGAESNYLFLTFLHGPRSCIGEKFARAELRALVAGFVGCFEVCMADPEEVVVAGGVVTIKPVNGMRLRLAPVGWSG
ncbi:cytochrome P450 3A4 [Massariosphaeria phaeospora]|uniref:Cytochrome P450 3A4 n=1 Tax=Massariosphaeria phaeospora TaxID=100035 RepID=A0A7C8MHB4_9PLEO|nr:cytochrome P450 3A4 [Massariosphaeria phaeospora]